MAMEFESGAGAPSGASDSPMSAIHWGPVIAGAVGAAVITLLLMILGTGLGLSMVSPWDSAGAAAGTVAISAAIWLVVVQWLSSAFGGYLAGRLRTRWSRTHEDEVFFRDTAHGFLSWALATLVVATLLGSTVSSIVGSGVQAVASVTSGAAQGATQGAAQNEQLTSSLSGADPSAYFLDMMFRPAANATPQGDTSDPRAEASRILLSGAAAGEIPADDKAYLVQMVSARTGLAAPEAQQRVDAVLAQADAAAVKAKEVAEAARQSAVTTSLLTFAALLIGAFVACVGAALGGRQRDEYDSANPLA
ncbi:hypothetical protein [Pararhizobium sp.]|uniref:hypothetical protein n=1 Tax=Pararhizobium sp. TaxID=1977563 RepID=UPI002726AAB6|nr:hypothetical protein [Pararhizobium sp.]MDO9417497.1 hypothetical protein [Pararhizobium sp.]